MTNSLASARRASLLVRGSALNSTEYQKYSHRQRSVAGRASVGMSDSLHNEMHHQRGKREAAQEKYAEYLELEVGNL